MKSFVSLTIYIPTFNRPKSLEKQIRILIPQIKKYREKVRVIINDNCSTTSLLHINSLISENNLHGVVELKKNPGNIGANANIALGFCSCAQKDHLWILSDDDYVSPEVLDLLLPELDGNHDVILLDIRKGILINELLTDEYNTFYELHDSGAGLISNVIYRMETFSNSINAAFLFQESSFPHLAVLLFAASERGGLFLRFLNGSRYLEINDKTLEGDSPGNYDISLTGMPQLAVLMNRRVARKFLSSWYKNHWIDYLSLKNRLRPNYLKTRAIIKGWGSSSLIIHMIIIAPLVYPIFAPILSNKPRFVKLAKRFLSEKLFSKLRDFFQGIN
jgi:glycosyltransferase involved in cell wall biosynthesis